MGAPERVELGVYLRNADGIDFRSNSYSLSFTLWLKWKGDLDPCARLTFVNQIDQWAMTVTPVFDEPRTLADGSRYQRLNVEGRFFHKFWLGTFPLDWQKLTIEVEDAAHPVSELEYVADASSKVRDGLTVPGWEIADVNSEVRVVDPGTTLGEHKQAFSHYTFSMKLQRMPSFFWLKMVPPILLTVISCFFVVRLAARSIDVRAGTIVVALLTAVLLQQQFEAMLPGVGLQFLLDHIFNLSYVVMVGLLIESIIVARLWDRAVRLDEAHLETLRRKHDAALAARPNEAVDGMDYAASALPGEDLRRRIDLCDRVSFIAAPSLYLLGCVLVVWLVRGSLA